MTRTVEVPLALTALIFIAPVMMCIALLILITEGRPVFFLARRMKAPDVTFQMIKFRTMEPCSAVGVTGGAKVMKVTRTGGWLRRFRLDEFPQILNVILGDMSFVGPRPPAPEHVGLLPAHFRRVLKVKPGITGLATLAVFRHDGWLLARAKDQEAAEATYGRICLPRKARIDRIYANHRSLATDLWLMFLTMTAAVGALPTGRLLRRRKSLAKPVPGGVKSNYANV